MNGFDYPLFFLILSRVAGFTMTAAVFSTKGIPTVVKIGFVMTLSYLLYSIVPHSALIETTFMGLMLQVAFETIYGMALGFTTFLLFSAFQMAGNLIDFQAGLSMGATYDPTSQTSVSIFGKVYNWTGLMIFILLDAHHIAIRALAHTFTLIPAGSMHNIQMDATVVLKVFSGSFMSAFALSLPLVITLFMTDIVLGLIARTVPQINVFILGMPLKILVSVTLMIVLVPSLVQAMGPVVGDIPKYMDQLLKSIK